MATADCMITTIEEYNALRDSIIKRLEDLSKQLSNKDSELSDCHHYLEFNSCNAATMAKISSRMTTILRERRLIKDQMMEMQAIKDKVCGGKILKDSKAKREYSVRTHVLDDITTSRTWVNHHAAKGE